MEDDEEAFCEVFQDDHQYQLALVHPGFVYLWFEEEALHWEKKTVLICRML